MNSLKHKLKTTHIVVLIVVSYIVAIGLNLPSIFFAPTQHTFIVSIIFLVCSIAIIFATIVVSSKKISIYLIAYWGLSFIGTMLFYLDNTIDSIDLGFLPILSFPLLLFIAPIFGISLIDTQIFHVVRIYHLEMYIAGIFLIFSVIAFLLVRKNKS